MHQLKLQESKRQEPHIARIVQILKESIIMKMLEVMQEQVPTLEYLPISASIRQLLLEGHIHLELHMVQRQQVGNLKQ